MVIYDAVDRVGTFPTLGKTGINGKNLKRIIFEAALQ